MRPLRFQGPARPLAVDDVDTAVFDGEAVVFHESSGNVHLLGGMVGAVWVMCDGSTSVHEMGAELRNVFALEADELAQMVDDSLTHLADHGLLLGEEARWSDHNDLSPQP